MKCERFDITLPDGTRVSGFVCRRGYARREPVPPTLPKEVLGFCRSCQRPVYWVKIDGKMQPVERNTDEKGTIELRLNVKTNTVTAERVAAGSKPSLHLSHFAICKDADAWRQRRLKGT